MFEGRRSKNSSTVVHEVEQERLLYMISSSLLPSLHRRSGSWLAGRAHCPSSTSDIPGPATTPGLFRWDAL